MTRQLFENRRGECQNISIYHQSRPSSSWNPLIAGMLREVCRKKLSRSYNTNTLALITRVHKPSERLDRKKWGKTSCVSQTLSRCENVTYGMIIAVAVAAAKPVEITASMLGAPFQTLCGRN